MAPRAGRYMVAVFLCSAVLCPPSPLASPFTADPSRSVRMASLTAFGGAPMGKQAEAISVARRYLGGNPTGRRSAWCADFVNLVERRVGRRGTGSRLARSYLAYGRPVRDPKPGDIVVLWRGSKRGSAGHVGYYLSASGGHVTLISGNHGRRVGIGRYPKTQVLGYRRP